MEQYELKIFECPFQDIAKNENPAFKKSLYYDPYRPDWYCIMICKAHPETRHASAVGDRGYIVLDVSSNVPDVLHLGLFWDRSNAELFANAYIKRNDLSEIAKRVL